MKNEAPPATHPPPGRSAENETEEAPKRSLWQSPFFWATLGGLIAIPLMRPCLRFEPPPPPVFGELPSYSLVDQSGGAFGSDQLAGKAYIASFFFTSCRSICPLLTAAMGHLDGRFSAEGIEGVHLVSVSVDPEWDTPERLRAYGEAHRVDPARWALLTGEPETVEALVYGGFRLALGDPVGTLEASAVPGDGRIHRPDGFDIAHSGKLVLVDGQGRIRGYYDTDELGLDEVFHRTRHVLNERP